MSHDPVAYAENMTADALIASGMNSPKAYALAANIIRLLQHPTPRVNRQTLARPMHPEDRMYLLDNLQIIDAVDAYDVKHGDPDGMEQADRIPLYAALDDVITLAD